MKRNYLHISVQKADIMPNDDFDEADEIFFFYLRDNTVKTSRQKNKINSST